MEELDFQGTNSVQEILHKRVLSPGVQHWRIIRPDCISFVFNLHPERKEGRDFGTSRGIQLYVLWCTLQFNDFATGSLSAFRGFFLDGISVELRPSYFYGGLFI